MQISPPVIIALSVSAFFIDLRTSSVECALNESILLENLYYSREVFWSSEAGLSHVLYAK